VLDIRVEVHHEVHKGFGECSIDIMVSGRRKNTARMDLLQNGDKGAMEHIDLTL